MVTHTKDNPLHLYTEQQIESVCSFCCSSPHGKTTVLGFDKTFNLGNVHLTVCNFKNLSVKRKDTNDHPIFAGPMLLPGNSDLNTFRQFFQHPAWKLEDTTTTISWPVTGSDEKRAMCRAAEEAIPGAGRLSCTRHPQSNAQDYLRDKVGLANKERTNIIKTIFGPSSLAEADDVMMFDCRLQITKEICQEIAPNFIEHFEKNIAPRLLNNLQVSSTVGLILPERSWTNNNAESLNHVIKHAFDWKQKSLPDMILRLEEVGNRQYREIKRSLLSLGNFYLSDSHTNFAVQRAIWSATELTKRERHVSRFLRHITPHNSKFVVSTDGSSLSKSMLIIHSFIHSVTLINYLLYIYFFLYHELLQ